MEIYLEVYEDEDGCDWGEYGEIIKRDANIDNRQIYGRIEKHLLASYARDRKRAIRNKADVEVEKISCITRLFCYILKQRFACNVWIRRDVCIFFIHEFVDLFRKLFNESLFYHNFI